MFVLSGVCVWQFLRVGCGGCHLCLLDCFAIVVIVVNSVVVLRFFAAGLVVCIMLIGLDRLLQGWLLECVFNGGLLVLLVAC